MLWSNTFIPTLRQIPQDAESLSHQLLLRAGLIRMLLAGVYSYLPLGLKVLKNIETIIRQEMDSCGASELLLPALQPMELWQRSGRDKDIGEVMIRFTDRRKRNLSLGPTHEEVITDLVKNHISSYRQLPLILYQIQTKFRDEIRPRFGLVRSCEFIMKDAYSFDKDEQGLDKNYKAMYEAYKRIFKRCGLEILITEADPGVMGGSVSHEYMAPARDGEDLVVSCHKCKFTKTFKEGETDICPKCNVSATSRGGSANFATKNGESARHFGGNFGGKLDKINAIEVGHIFKLGTKYTSVLGANFLDAQGKLKPIIMGCFGIGVSRLISAIIEQNNDADGITWPKEVAPYKVIVLALDVTDKKVRESAYGVYKELKQVGMDVLLDDRDESPGVKFKDADLLGLPLQVIIGRQSQRENKIELKIRRTQKKIIKPKSEILKEIKTFYNALSTK